MRKVEFYVSGTCPDGAPVVFKGFPNQTCGEWPVGVLPAAPAAVKGKTYTLALVDGKYDWKAQESSTLAAVKGAGLTLSALVAAFVVYRYVTQEKKEG